MQTSIFDLLPLLKLENLSLTCLRNQQLLPVETLSPSVWVKLWSINSHCFPAGCWLLVMLILVANQILFFSWEATMRINQRRNLGLREGKN